jgi:hypothetical protein
MLMSIEVLHRRLSARNQPFGSGCRERSPREEHRSPPYSRRADRNGSAPRCRPLAAARKDHDTTARVLWERSRRTKSTIPGPPTRIRRPERIGTSAAFLSLGEEHCVDGMRPRIRMPSLPGLALVSDAHADHRDRQERRLSNSFQVGPRCDRAPPSHSKWRPQLFDGRTPAVTISGDSGWSAPQGFFKSRAEFWLATILTKEPALVVARFMHLVTSIVPVLRPRTSLDPKWNRIDARSTLIAGHIVAKTHVRRGGGTVLLLRS